MLDDDLQIVGGEVGVELGFGFVFALVEDVIELLHIDVERHFAEHLNEAAVGIVGEAGVVTALGQAFDGFIVEAQIQDGIHHPRHGKFRTGADADQQRIFGVAQLLADLRFEFFESFQNLIVNLFRNAVVIFEVDVADFGGDGESRRHGNSGAGHFGKSGAFAAQDIFHGAVAIGVAGSEAINVFSHFCSPAVTISEKSAIVEKLKRISLSKVRRLARTFGSGALTRTLSKKRSMAGRSDAICPSAV